MGRHVLLQALPLVELLPANTAGVGRCFSVLPGVALQRSHVTKGTRALFTFERFL